MLPQKKTGKLFPYERFSEDRIVFMKNIQDFLIEENSVLADDEIKGLKSPATELLLHKKLHKK